MPDDKLIAECRDVLLRSWGQQPGLREPGLREADYAARNFVAMMRAYEAAYAVDATEGREG